MKTVFFFIACSCLINGLTASFPGFYSEDEETNFDNEIAPRLDILFPDLKNADALIVPFPTDAKPTTTTPSTTTEFTSTTPSARPTRPPRPTRPTRPTPTTSTTTTTTTTTTPTRPPRPTRPTRPTPTTSTTTTTTTTTTPTRPPRPTRPTRPPTSTTPRPDQPLRPQPPSNGPRPELERIQVYKNAVRSLGPFAGRLVNIVSNNRGSQKTLQKNEIVYNLKSFTANGE